MLLLLTLPLQVPPSAKLYGWETRVLAVLLPRLLLLCAAWWERRSSTSCAARPSHCTRKVGVCTACRTAAQPQQQQQCCGQRHLEQQPGAAAICLVQGKEGRCTRLDAAVHRVGSAMWVSCKRKHVHGTAQTMLAGTSTHAIAATGFVTALQ